MEEKTDKGGLSSGTWFISHNRADKPDARALGVALLAQDIGVWLDEWEVQAGDRIVHAINVALDSASGIIALWSKNASRSRWVDRELNAATHRSVGDSSFRVIPVMLDDSPLPPLLAEVKAIDWRPEANRLVGLGELIRATSPGKSSERRSILAGIANLCDHIGVPMNECWGVMVCRHCGSEELETFQSTDDEHDRAYACVRCRQCNWEEGTEI